MIDVYKDGDVAHCFSSSQVKAMEAKGWSRDKPDDDELPRLDLEPFDNAKLLHIAAVANVEVPSGSSRDEIIDALTRMWEGLGRPPGWLEAAVDAPAPKPPEEIEIPKAVEVIEPVSTGDFKAPVAVEVSDPAMEE